MQDFSKTRYAQEGFARLVILTHHKCGTTWVGWLVHHVCELNGLTMFRSHLGTATPSAADHISLLSNSQYAQVSGHLGHRNLHIIRNPLSVVLSAYHSHCSTHPTHGWPALDAQRALLQQRDEAEGMLLTLAFLESAGFYPDTPGPLHAIQAWNYDDERIETMRMEDITRDVESFLGKICQHPDYEDLVLPNVSDFLFESFTGRSIGVIDNNSHYRSGSPDAWRAELPPSVVAYVRAHFRPLLQRYYPEALD